MERDESQSVGARAERRHCRRVTFSTRVQCGALERNEVMTAHNVSPAGMFLDARIPFPIDTEVLLTFQIRPSEAPLNCNAQVIFSRSGVGMGVKFLDLSGEARQTLKAFVEETEQEEA